MTGHSSVVTEDRRAEDRLLPGEARVADVAAAAVAGWALSGGPSTLWNLARGQDVLASSRAAGTMVLGEHASPGALLAAGLAAHTVISIGWTVVLAAWLPRRRTVAAGALGGLAIAALDLGVIGRRFPAVRALDPRPQVADHLAFGIVVATVLGGRRSQAAGRTR